MNKIGLLVLPPNGPVYTPAPSIGLNDISTTVKKITYDTNHKEHTLI